MEFYLFVYQLLIAEERTQAPKILHCLSFKMSDMSNTVMATAISPAIQAI